jgi:hypothetical protein
MTDGSSETTREYRAEVENGTVNEVARSKTVTM